MLAGLFLDQKRPICYNYSMKTLSFTIELPRQRRRALELYSRNTPFKPKAEKSRVAYNRKVKHRQRDEH